MGGATTDLIQPNIPASLDDMRSTSTMAIPQESQKFDTFTCFLDLPAELRLQIWAEVAKQPRVLPVSEMGRDIDMDEEHFEQFPFAILRRSKNLQPAVLQVCQESREECLRFFERIPSTLVDSQIKPLGHTPVVYTKADCDTIYLSSRFYDDFVSFGGVKSFQTTWQDSTIKSVAFDVGDFAKFKQWENNVYCALSRHRNVRDIILVLARDDQANSAQGHLELVEVVDETDRELAAEAMKQVASIFRFVESEFRGYATVLYGRKPRKPVLNIDQFGKWAALSMMMNAEEEEYPDEESRTRFIEAAKFRHTEVKVKGLVKGGVKLW